MKSLFKRIVRTLAAAGLLVAPPALADHHGGEIGTPVGAELDRSDADPALWKLSDEDTTIYLFGTMHALQPDLVWFDDAVGEAFASADELVMEMVAPDPAVMQKYMAEAAIMPSGSSLSALLDDDQRAELASAAQKIGIPMLALDRMQPWFAAVTLSTAPLRKLGYNPEVGAEAVLEKAAREKGMDVSGLETFEQQMGFFSGLSQEAQIEFLMAGLDEIDGMEQTFIDMERAWGTGDIAATAALVNEGLAEQPQVFDILLAGRNEAWAEWIADRMTRPGTVFMAVGAGHLAGEASVQSYLAANDLMAERVAY